jgi:hypothetical protein
MNGMASGLGKSTGPIFGDPLGLARRDHAATAGSWVRPAEGAEGFGSDDAHDDLRLWSMDSPMGERSQTMCPPLRQSRQLRDFTRGYSLVANPPSVMENSFRLILPTRQPRSGGFPANRRAPLAHAFLRAMFQFRSGFVVRIFIRQFRFRMFAFLSAAAVNS